MVGPMSRLSVVIPATDDPPTLDRCRAAIAAAAHGPDEVIEVTAPSHLSAAGARNHGVRRATGDIVVFVDADVEVHPDVFTRIRSAFETDRSVAGVIGSYDDAPDHPSTVSAFRNLLHHRVHHDNAGPVETFWTGLGAIRRSAFLATGGFDEDRYPHPSVEDIDLGDRMARAGMRIVLDPQIQGTHLKRWTLRSMVHTDFARRALPWIAMQVRNRRLSTALNLGWRHRFSALAAAALVLAPLLAVARASAALALFAAAATVLVVLNAGLYGLLLRRLGPARGSAGVVLHIVHHLTAVVALPIGLVAALSPRNLLDRTGAARLPLELEEAA